MQELLKELPSDAELNEAYKSNNGRKGVKRAGLAVFGDLLPNLVADPCKPDGNKASA